MLTMPLHPSLPDTPEMRALLSQLGYDAHPGESDRPDRVAAYEDAQMRSTGVMEYPQFHHSL